MFVRQSFFWVFRIAGVMGILVGVVFVFMCETSAALSYNFIGVCFCGISFIFRSDNGGEK